MQTDMTVGKPMKMILDFTIPVFIGNVFQQFYNMADAIIVGKICRNKRAGSGWFNRNDHVSDHRFSYGTDSRFYSSDLTEIRCGKDG